MKLLTKALIKQFETQGSTELSDPKDVKVIAKYFHPIGAATWYITEYIPTENMFFGFCNLGDDQMAELGYVSISELESLTVRGLKVERDLYFGDHTLDEVMYFKVR